VTPYFQIQTVGTGANGTNGPWQDYSGIMLDLMVTDESKEHSDQFEVKLSDAGNHIILPQRGQQVLIQIGQDGKALKSAMYVIDEVDIEGPPDVIQIRGSACPFANAQTLTAMQTRRSRSWDNITLGSLVQGMAAEHGLTAAVDSSLSETQVDHVDQTDESNMNFLVRMARRYGAVFKPVKGALALAAIGGGMGLGSGAALPVVPITRGPGMKWRCAISKRADFDGVQTSATDVPGGGSTDASAGSTGTGSKVFRDATKHPSLDVAQRAAKSKLRFFKMGSCALELNLPGCLAVSAEQKLQLTGWRPEVSGAWVAKKITVTLSKNAGLRTLIECETPGDGSEPREQVLGNSETGS
jgi:hypothetical protein